LRAPAETSTILELDGGEGGGRIREHVASMETALTSCLRTFYTRFRKECRGICVGSRPRGNNIRDRDKNLHRLLYDAKWVGCIGRKVFLSLPASAFENIELVSTAILPSSNGAVPLWSLRILLISRIDLESRSKHSRKRK